MDYPTLFPDDLLDIYFSEDDCSSNCFQNHHLEELVSERGDMESFLKSPPRLRIDLDSSFTEPQSPQSKQDSSEHITDDDLINLPIRDLNKRLRNLSKDAVQKIRKRRRSLKNRGYATSCRQRRAAVKESLKTQNKRLEAQLRDTKKRLSESVKERDSYKSKYESLHKVYATLNTSSFITKPRI